MSIYYDVLKMDDLDKMVALFEKYLNSGTGVRAYLVKVLKKKDTIACKCEDESGLMLGFVMYSVGIALSGSHENICEKVKAISKNALTYTGDALAVRKEYRKSGVAHELMKNARAEIRKKAIHSGSDLYVLHELWMHVESGYVPADHVVKKIYPETIHIGDYPEFYQNFDQFGFVCPICGSDCHCSAKLVLSRVDGKE